MVTVIDVVGDMEEVFGPTDKANFLANIAVRIVCAVLGLADKANGPEDIDVSIVEEVFGQTYLT